MASKAIESNQLRASEVLPLTVQRKGYFPSSYLCSRKVPEIAESVILTKFKASQVRYFPKN